MDLLSFLLYGNTAQLKLRLLAQAPVALPRRFAKILCSDFGFGSLREFRPRCRDFLQYGKYCCKFAPHQYAKFDRKSLLFNYAVLPNTLTGENQ